MAAKETYKRRRRSFNAAMTYAIKRGYIDGNPVAALERQATARKGAIDPRILMNPVQAKEFLVAVSYVGSVHRNRGRRLVAFFGCILYAAMRPAEVVALRRSDCELPETGWGLLTLRKTRPVAGKKWTDTGERHDRRGLKMREPDADRPVPIPPALVAMLREHLKEFDTAKHKVNSPLAEKPYAGRAFAITQWLKAGVAIAEVVRRAGTSPEVIDRHYAGLIDNSEEEDNEKIEKGMGWASEGAA